MLLIVLDGPSMVLAAGSSGGTFVGVCDEERAPFFVRCRSVCLARRSSAFVRCKSAVARSSFVRITPASKTHHSLGLQKPPYDSEYPGYLRLPALVQKGTQTSTPQTFQIGYLLTEALTSSWSDCRPPLSPCRGPQAALNCSHRGDSVTRDWPAAF